MPNEKVANWRQRVAEQLKWVRAMELDDYLVTRRDAVGYVETLLGLQAMFSYIREHSSQLGSNLVLDIGAGTTEGISRLSESDYGQGLAFKGVVLRAGPEVDKWLGRRNVLITPVETLRGIDENSVAGVVSVNGIAYSAAPVRAIQMVDKVLVQGGLLKASFLCLERWDSQKKMFPHNKFTRALRSLGYDIEIISNSGSGVDVVLAVKPGGRVSAEAIMKEDLDTYQGQVEFLKGEVE